MAKYGVLPFRFNFPASGQIDPRFSSLYYSIAKGCEGADVERADYPHLTIPLTYEMTADSSLTFSIVQRFASKWASEASLYICDLANPPDQPLPSHHVLRGLAEFVSRSLESSRMSRRFLVMLPTLIPRADSTLLPIEKYFEAGQVAFIADDGSSLSTPRFGQLICRSDYVAALRSARGSIAQIVQKKLLRFPGHFKRSANGRHSHCVANFFDGRLCEAELVDLLDEYVTEWSSGKERPSVFYHSTVSSWLNRAIRALEARRGIVVPNLDDVQRFETAGSSNEILIIVPLVDTGETVGRLYQKAKGANENGNVRFLSVLTTKKGGSDRNSFVQRVGQSEIVVDYFIEVEQQRFQLGSCPLCASNIGPSDPNDPDPYVKMSAQAFWSIGMRLGFAPERDVPDYREPVGYLPQFRNIADEDGPYLAYKIEKLLRHEINLLPATPIFLCPQEDGASKIGEWLEFIYRMTVIRIPKRVLGTPDIRHELYAIKDGEYAEDWVVKLVSLTSLHEEVLRGEPILAPERIPVIVLDEVNVSGRTRQNLLELAEELGLDVMCCISLLDLAGRKTPGKCPVFSLYDVNRYEMSG